MLTEAQLSEYTEQGFLILRGAISDHDIQRLERGVANNPPLDGTLDPYAPEYPAPGRYTLATQSPRDPDLAFIIEHETIVSSVRSILDDDPVLTAYVIYDRTPDGPGLGAHHDYKRWRPVGSSMHWLFTIVPFCDFDEDAGPLYINTEARPWMVEMLMTLRPRPGPSPAGSSAIQRRAAACIRYHWP